MLSSFWAVLNHLHSGEILTVLSVMIASSPFLSNVRGPIPVPLPSAQSSLAESRMLHKVKFQAMWDSSGLSERTFHLEPRAHFCELHLTRGYLDKDMVPTVE